MPKVRVTRGDEVLVGFILGDRAITLGRGHESDIHVADRRLSRRHCRLEVVNGEVVVTDLESTKGIYYGGERVASRTLKETDEFYMGDVRVSVAPERLKAGTIEFAVPGGEAAAGAAFERADETGTFPAPEHASPELPKGLLECTRRLEKLVDELAAVYDQLDRALGHDPRHAPILKRLREVTIEAEALVGD